MLLLLRTGTPTYRQANIERCTIQMDACPVLCLATWRKQEYSFLTKYMSATGRCELNSEAM